MVYTIIIYFARVFIIIDISNTMNIFGYMTMIMVYHPSPKEKYHGSTLILIYTKSPYVGINFHIFKSIYKNVHIIFDRLITTCFLFFFLLKKKVIIKNINK
jgi:hypothetical protein